jgi:hypothetical protein
MFNFTQKPIHYTAFQFDGSDGSAARIAQRLNQGRPEHAEVGDWIVGTPTTVHTVNVPTQFTVEVVKPADFEARFGKIRDGMYPDMFTAKVQ